MTRMMVIGNAGGGKSTLCRAISVRHGMASLSIDDIQWRPGWVPVSHEDYTRQHDAWLDGQRWLIDGYGDWPSVQKRMQQADTIIMVDLPFRVHLWWAAKRQVKSMFIGCADGPKGCPMLPVTFRLFRMMWTLHHCARPKLLSLMAQQADHARIIHIRSVPQLNAFAKNPV